MVPPHHLSHAAVVVVGDVEVAGGVHREAYGYDSWAEAAGPPSPRPVVPPPATVAMVPEGSTLRTRLLPLSVM